MRRIRVPSDEFDCSARARAWARADELLSVDATIEVELRSVVTPASGVVGIIHGHLARPAANTPFAVPITEAHIRDIVIASRSLAEMARGPFIRVEDARYRMRDCAVEPTRAPQYAGAAEEILEQRLGLGSAPWMQDWPCEVANPGRIAEFCAFYEASRDPLVRFDVMQLLLFSYEESVDLAPCAAWFEETLRQDFALHGHTIADWACLELDASDPDLRREAPEIGFRISGTARRIWEACLAPIEVTS